MTSKLPYMLSTGLIPTILEKIQNARRPDRFTLDFLGTKLGHSGGSARAIIPMLKRMGFLGSDGVPTNLYDQFRNTETQGSAVAKGMKNAFRELFDRNEYVNDAKREELTGHVVEITGGTKTDTRTKAVVATFSALNKLADFEAKASENTELPSRKEIIPAADTPLGTEERATGFPGGRVEMRVGYTINLNLPETTDPEVFNAIFRSLRENLLRN